MQIICDVTKFMCFYNTSKRTLMQSGYQTVAQNHPKSSNILKITYKVIGAVETRTVRR